MKINETGPVEADREQLVPLINIVFLLLIFFMVMGGIDRTRIEAVDLPVTTTEHNPKQADSSITLTRHGEIHIDSRRYDLDQALEIFTARFAGAQTDTTGGLTIHADRRLRNGTLDRLLEALRSVGVDKVNLVVIAN